MAVQDSSNPGHGALRSVLASHNFRRLYSIRLAGQFGDGLLQSALATFVLFSPEREPDAVRVAAAFAILLLPYSFIGPFAGVLLDRWQRRNVLVRANLLKSLFTVPIIVVVGAGQADFVLGVFVLIVLGVSRFITGLSASMPHVVNGRLITGNALAPTSGTIAVGVGGIIGVDRAFAGGGNAGVSCSRRRDCFLRRREFPRHPAGRPRTRTRPWGTSRYVRQRRSRTRPRRADTVGQGSRTQHHGHDHREPLRFRRPHRRRLLVRGSLHPPTDDAALVTSSSPPPARPSARSSEQLTPTMTRRIGIGPWVGIVMVQGGVVGFGLLTATAINPQLVTLVAGAASIGLAGQSVKVCADTVLQRSIPDDRLGRVFALFDMIVNIALVTGITVTAFASPISGQFTSGYLICGALLVLAAWWYRRSTRSPARRS